MILVGKVHGRIEVFKMINDVIHFPEKQTKGKMKGKLKWQATVVDPIRLATFEVKNITDEEAFEIFETKE